LYKKIILILLVFSFTSLLALDYNKYLKSQTRAEIMTQKLVDDIGDYEEAVEFSQSAIYLYPESLMISQYRAKALYLVNNLEESKQLFIHILEIDPSNDVAADFIVKIEAQEEAQKNKDLEEVLGYLSDKGLDFVMIFLGFLGAEVLAKRYNTCEEDKYLMVVERYVDNYYVINSSLLQKSIYTFREYFTKFFTICNLLTIIIILTLSIAISITLSWVEFMGYMSMILSEDDLRVITSDELWTNYLAILAIISLAIVINRVVALIRTPTETEVEVADILQELAVNNEFSLLRENINIINSIVSDADKDKILEACISQDARDMIEELLVFNKR